MTAESIREERNRLIVEIAERAERLRYLTELLEQRFEVVSAGKIRPPVQASHPVEVIRIKHKAADDNNVTINGKRMVTQK